MFAEFFITSFRHVPPNDREAPITIGGSASNYRRMCISLGMQHGHTVGHRRPRTAGCAGRHRRVVGYVSAIGASFTRALWSGALDCSNSRASRSMKLRLRDGHVNTTKVLGLLYSERSREELNGDGICQIAPSSKMTT